MLEQGEERDKGRTGEFEVVLVAAEQNLASVA